MTSNGMCSAGSSGAGEMPLGRRLDDDLVGSALKGDASTPSFPGLPAFTSLEALSGKFEAELQACWITTVGFDAVADVTDVVGIIKGSILGAASCNGAWRAANRFLDGELLQTFKKNPPSAST